MSSASVDRDSAKHRADGRSVFSLCLIFLGTSIVAMLLEGFFTVSVMVTIVLVPFCLAATGALVCFHFLDSTARVKRHSWMLGGAVAGFFVLFYTFYRIVSQPSLHESRFYRLATDDIADQLLGLAQERTRIDAYDNSTLEAIAEQTLRDTRDTLSALARGEYLVNAPDLPSYLMPMIDNTKHTYYATQYVLPSTFWAQYWSHTYFEKNVAAVRDRHVDLKRIFLIDPAETDEERRVLDDLLQKHIDNNITVHIIDTASYPQPDDLRDFVIADGELTGILQLTKRGGFQRVEFSVNPGVIEERQRTFERLLNFSQPAADWLRAHATTPPNGPP